MSVARAYARGARPHFLLAASALLLLLPGAYAAFVTWVLWKRLRRDRVLRFLDGAQGPEGGGAADGGLGGEGGRGRRPDPEDPRYPGYDDLKLKGLATGPGAVAPASRPGSRGSLKGAEGSPAGGTPRRRGRPVPPRTRLRRLRAYACDGPGEGAGVEPEPEPFAAVVLGGGAAAAGSGADEAEAEARPRAPRRLRALGGPAGASPSSPLSALRTAPSEARRGRRRAPWRGGAGRGRRRGGGRGRERGGAAAAPAAAPAPELPPGAAPLPGCAPALEEAAGADARRRQRPREPTGAAQRCAATLLSRSLKLEGEDAEEQRDGAARAAAPPSPPQGPGRLWALPTAPHPPPPSPSPAPEGPLPPGPPCPPCPRKGEEEEAALPAALAARLAAAAAAEGAAEGAPAPRAAAAAVAAPRPRILRALGVDGLWAPPGGAPGAGQGAEFAARYAPLFDNFRFERGAYLYHAVDLVKTIVVGLILGLVRHGGAQLSLLIAIQLASVGYLAASRPLRKRSENVVQGVAGACQALVYCVVFALWTDSISGGLATEIMIKVMFGVALMMGAHQLAGQAFAAPAVARSVLAKIRALRGPSGAPRPEAGALAPPGPGPGTGCKGKPALDPGPELGEEAKEDPEAGAATTTPAEAA
eukprot:tig00000190_g13855.t1